MHVTIFSKAVRKIKNKLVLMNTVAPHGAAASKITEPIEAYLSSTPSPQFYSLVLFALFRHYRKANTTLLIYLLFEMPLVPEKPTKANTRLFIYLLSEIPLSFD